MIPYGRQTIEDDDIAAVAAALRGDFLTTGPKVEEFEAALAKVAGVNHAVAMSSGTAALHAAVGPLTPDDSVAVPALTFAATANAVRFWGAKPVFVDVDPVTGLIDPTKIPPVNVIIAVDYAGCPADYDALLRDEAMLIADASHSLGATYKGRPVGSLADRTTLSFHPVKSITTGEGGAVTTDHGSFLMRGFRNHGMFCGDQLRLGYNYRLTDFQCALGLSQLAKLPRFITRRTELAKRYSDNLEGVELPFVPPDRTSAWHLYVIQTDRRDELKAYLAERGIGSQVHYRPVYDHPYYRDYPRNCPNAERFAKRCLSLPLYPTLSESDQDRVIEAINAFSA